MAFHVVHLHGCSRERCVVPAESYMISSQLRTFILMAVAYIVTLVVLFAQSLPQSSTRGFSYTFYARAYNASFTVSNVISACTQLFATLFIVYKGWCVNKVMSNGFSIVSTLFDFRLYWRDVRMFSHQSRYGIAMLAVFIETSIVYFAFLVSSRFNDVAHTDG